MNHHLGKSNNARREKTKKIQFHSKYLQISNLYKLYPLKDYSAQNANPPVEKSGSPPHTLGRRQHPGRHQRDYKNPV